jgi:hypothetical protein
MTRENTRTLRVISYFLLACAIIVQILLSNGTTKTDISTGIISLVAIAIGLLLLAELGPFIKSLSAGGLNLEFAQDFSSGLNAMEKRVGALELAAAKQPKQMESKDDIAEAPALKRPVINAEDTNKGRFGSLGATFSSLNSRDWVRVNLLVRATPSAGEIDAGQYVEFFLHSSFDPAVYKTPFVDNVASLSVLAFGGFTVGAWIPSRRIELELDLAEIRKAPRIIREL